MSISELQGTSVPIKLWINYQEVEESALKQLYTIAALPWVFKHVAVMPDVHWGNGATVGSVIAMKNAITPAAVGVDIGCGMAAIKTSMKASQLPDNLKPLREAIEDRVPVGFNWHPDDKQCNRFRHGQLMVDMRELWKKFDTLHENVQSVVDKARLQMGTLGGGNHFLEVCLDTDQNVWIMLHSGSRNIGNELAKTHMDIARKLIHNRDLPDQALAVFLSGTPEMDAYRRDLFWAQEYARLNRYVMIGILQDVMKNFFPKIEFQEAVHCHHNYVSEENHFGEDLLVTRKGAISARLGEMGLIPGSMGTQSFVVRGKGNEESFHSAPHGAGRRMSRGAAKKHFTAKDLKEQTEGVECRKDAGVLDEIPGAYKNVKDVVRKNSVELVEVVAELKQVLCVKG